MTTLLTPSQVGDCLVGGSPTRGSPTRNPAPASARARNLAGRHPFGRNASRLLPPQLILNNAHLL